MVQRLHIDVMCSMMLSFWQINIVRYRSSFLESTLLWGMAYYRKLFWSIALVLCLALEYHTISSSFHSKCRYIYTRITSLKNNKNSYSVFLRNCKKRTMFFKIRFHNIYLQQLLVQKYTNVIDRNKSTVESITAPLQYTDFDAWNSVHVEK